jgi:hypothetical protein
VKCTSFTPYVENTNQRGLYRLRKNSVFRVGRELSRHKCHVIIEGFSP